MVVLSTIAVIQTAPNLAALLDGYGAESAIKGMPPFNAQMGAYSAMEAAGILHPLVAFDGDVLVGFLLLLIAPLPHYGVKVATTESFFVAPEYRDAGHGLRLLRAAEVHAATLGAACLLVSAPKDGRLAAVLERLPHYSETNRVFFKGLTDA